MKALVYTQPLSVELQDLPEPEPGPGEVLLRVGACGVCGSDMHGYFGRSKRRVPPLVLGHEFSGEAVAVGSGVTGVSTGDAFAVYPLITCGQCLLCLSGRGRLCPRRRIFGLDIGGALAEYVAAPASCLFPLPQGLSFTDGALVEPLANCVHLLSHVQSVEGKRGIIYGAGSIGVLTWWLARRLGASGLAIVDVNPKRLERLKKMGADLVVNAAEEDAEAVLGSWSGGWGADFTIDAVGNEHTRGSAVTTTASGGVSVWIGLESDECALSGLAIVNREIEIKGSYAYGRDDFAQSLRLIEQGLLKDAGLVTEVALSDGPRVFQALAAGSDIVKAVFTF